ncbi:tryptophan synthase subunit alpha [Planctomicrobium sp. SH661]|uniref:tryptophan synthase subunit alpha n=1 Tax=Planctomicrobium sp. SH661 TaxID=3448124 RepID=UPI003F5CA488
MSSRIAQTFAQLQSQGNMAFMPFLTAGDPDLSTTQQVIRDLGKAGVDLIEIGFPYSDPIADGPVIQASYSRALNKHVTVSQIFTALGELKSENGPPLVAMVSYAIIFRTGVEKFLQRCVEAGISGLIVPDLPGAEARELFEATSKAGLDLIQLIAPTTPRERVKQILSVCSGFVYIVAVAGTTGERANVSDALLTQLEWLRQETDLPLAVGFGISKPEHVEPLRGLAQGVIVGSAVVRYLEKLATQEPGSASPLNDLSTFAGQMVAATRSGSPA